MDPGRAPKRARDDALTPTAGQADTAQPPIPEDESDDEYENIPAKISKPPVPLEVDHPRGDETAALADLPPPSAPPAELQPPPDAEEEPRNFGTTDDEWLRSRTNRLLDLVDPDDPHFAAQRAPAPTDEPLRQIPAATTGPNEETRADSIPVLEVPEPRPAGLQDGETAADVIERTSRLFVRNLPYTATEDDLIAHFGSFGSLEEVREEQTTSLPQYTASPYDESQIGTAYALWHMMRTRARYFSRCFE